MEKNKPRRLGKKKERNFPEFFILILAAIAISCVLTLALIFISPFFQPGGPTPGFPNFNRLLSRFVSRESPSEERPATAIPGSRPPDPSALRESPPLGGHSITPSPLPAVSAALPAESPERRSPKGVLVFTIDDAGNSLEDLEAFLRIPGPLAIAVLPGLPHSAEAARRIRAAGKELLLHQPMEALGGEDPGPAALYAGMDAGEIKRIVQANLDEIGPVAGINNHQGSKITMDREMMTMILEICRERGIYFLDSRTTADTAAPQAASGLGITIGERNVFLDNENDRESILMYLQTGLRRAEVQGGAVMIGHVWSENLAPILTELYPVLTAQGYHISTLSSYIKTSAKGETP